jgi:acyl-CoA synthetase (NDP forming)/GNAT superfamily N-acetyltransferase
MTAAAVTASDAAAWDVLLRDGRIAHVRTFVPADEEDLHRLNSRVSARTRLMRYFSVSDRPARWYVEHLKEQAATGNALVACLADQVVAIASYARLESDPGTADLGMLVDDDLQDSGLGSLLLEHLAHVARHHGITAFHADVHSENVHMLRMLRSSGFRATSTTSAGVVELAIDLVEGSSARAAEEHREITSERASLCRVLAPRSVAVVGSTRDGSVAQRVVRALRGYDFRGQVHVVDRPFGLQALTSPVDLVVVAVPAPHVLAVALEAASAGAAGLVVLSAGFAEDGPEGRLRQDELLRECRRAGMRLIGPNCLGILNSDPGVRLNATFCEATPPAGRVALVSQSGAVGVAALRNAERRRTGLSLFVSTGNKADVSGNDLLEYLAEDEQTSVIALYLESFGNPRKFARIASTLGRTKPIVVVKSGRSSAGARAGQSHTAAAATPDVATDALLRAAGAIRADDMPELFDLVALLEAAPLPAGRSVAVIGNSGGPGVLAVDAIARAGLTVAELAPETQAELRRLVPASASVQNPVDLLSTVTPEQMQAAVVALMRDPVVDAVITVYTPVTRDSEEAFAAALVRAGAEVPEVTLLATFPGVATPPKALARTGTPDLPFFEYPEQAARVLAKVVAHAEWRRAAAVAPESRTDAMVRTPELQQLVVADGTGRWLDPDEVAALLRAAGVPAVPALTVSDVAGAISAAEVLGYPVVLKAHGPSLVHKSDVGAVLLGLRDASEVAAAWAELTARLGWVMTGGVVQRQLATGDGLELVIGAYVEPDVGPLVMAGMGGTLTDIVDDRVLRVPPVTRDAALAQMRELRCAPALEGFRGRPALATEAAADLLIALGRLMDAFPEVREVDLNPVLVTPTGVWALDARIAVAPPGQELSAPFRSLRPPLTRRTP